MGALESVARALKTWALPTPPSPWPRQLLVAVPPGHAPPADLVECVAVAGHPAGFLEPNEDPLPPALLHAPKAPLRSAPSVGTALLLPRPESPCVAGG